MAIKLFSILLLSMILALTVQAGGRNFVDFDGDGFNDNIIDFDNNNIPDEFQAKVKEIKSQSRTFTFSPTSLFSNSSNQIKLSVSQKFSLHLFNTRLINKCRSSFDGDFATGLNINASSGGSCVGGICF